MPEAAASAVLSPLRPRDRWLVWAAIVVVTLIAWTYLVHLHHRMPGMHDSPMIVPPSAMTMPWTASDAWLTFAMWVVMMVAMMAASAAPAVLLYAGIHAKHDNPRVPAAVSMFAAGYGIVWVAFSAVATIAQWLLHETALLDADMAAMNGRIAGAILCAAGLYQLTPVQAACLRHCRSPLGFFMTHWRDGASGAVVMGMRHGIYCVGCCWALMIVLFAVGVMNLVWVAALAVLVLLEKVAPGGPALARIAGALMAIAGLLLLLGVR